MGRTVGVAGAAGTGSGPLDPQTIQLHIDDCERCRLVLAEAVRSRGADEAPAPAPFRTLSDGLILLGRYQIRRFIARGGMGEVYEAFDTVLAERVALKTLLPTALDDERAVERLAAEVRLARKVTHANVCRILEFGVYLPSGAPGAGIPFLTMEFLEGEPLSRRIATCGRLAPATISKLVADAVAGLAAVHAAGVVHRDFKSENVFLVPDGRDGERAVIMDFGLARGLGEAGRGSSTAAAGTPDYMAPEQVEGKPPTPAFDVYALGVVIFEMLTGRKPFAGSSPYMAALSRLHQRAPAPSDVAADISPAWDAVVGRCLERDPVRRYGRVEEIAREVQAALGASPAPRRRGPAGRRTAAVAMAGLALLSLGAWVLWPGRPGDTPVARAPEPVAPAPAAPVSPPVVAAAPAPAKTQPAPTPRRTPRVRPRPPEKSAQAEADRAPPPSPAPAEPTSAPVPPSEPALLDEAESLMLEGRVARACEVGERAATAVPPRPAIHLFLGKCYTRLGDPARARRHYRRYLELAPDAPDAVFVRAILEKAR
jgi:tRNA A-37 threonylcarbamoyl transferase component Bud32